MIPETSFKLNNSGSIPALGYGTHLVHPRNYPESCLRDCLQAAIRAGCRHIDTALRYDDGKAERDVGEAVRASGVPREEFFISTKL